MAEDIVKLFSRPGSPMILLFWPGSAIPNSQGNPFSGAQNTRGSRLSQKRCEIRRWLLWNINRKSWVPDQMVSFSMTLN